jgi:uncharacterized membrane protein
MRSDEESVTEGHGPESVEGLDGTGSDMSRILSISDGVFAFSLTFLVINLVLPTPGKGPYPDLFSFLAQEWPATIAYALSFFIIASWWNAHRRLFSPIVRYDGTLTRLNTIFLLLIAVTPFLVGILYEYGPGVTLGASTLPARVAVAIYAGAQSIAGLVLLGIWRHSTRGHRLVRPSLPPSWIHATEQMQLANVVVFALSIPVAFVAPFVSILMWILVIVGVRHILRTKRSRPAQRSLPG